MDRRKVGASRRQPSHRRVDLIGLGLMAFVYRAPEWALPVEGERGSLNSETVSAVISLSEAGPRLQLDQRSLSFASVANRRTA